MSYETNRDISFQELNIKSHDHRFNCHHVIQRVDRKKGLVPRNFPIDNKSNLCPLLIEEHEKLNEIINTNKFFRRNMSTRVYLANMALNRELDLVPDRLYFSDPKEIMRKSK